MSSRHRPTERLVEQAVEREDRLLLMSVTHFDYPLFTHTRFILTHPFGKGPFF